MYSVPWAKADLSAFDRSVTDKDKIEAGLPVPCRLCEAVYRTLTLTMRFCSTCEQGYCQAFHGAWVGRRGVCVRCGPSSTQAQLPEDLETASTAVVQTTALEDQQMVPFEMFWRRLQEEFGNAPMRKGHHVLDVQNWTQDKGDLPDIIPVFWNPGHDSGAWITGDKNFRPFSVAEVRKIYDVWRDYRAGRTRRSFITNTIGVQNSKPIIALFKRFEHLMV